jgi:hypothetical protein
MMIAIDRIAPFARSPDFAKHTLLQLGIASAIATGTLVAMSAADARTTKIVNHPPTIAFGCN